MIYNEGENERGIKMKANNKNILFLITLFILFPISASANVVWPSLYIAEGMLVWYVILAGLVIEFLFIKIFLKTSFLKAGLASVTMNLISALIGIFLIPISGLLAEVLLIPTNTPTFHISHWILSYILAVLSNVLTEGLAIRVIYKIKKAFWWLTLANAITVLLSIAVRLL